MTGEGIHFGVLGSLSVQHNGSSVPLNAPVLRQLLAVLLTKANQRVRTDDLIYVLWGEKAPNGARKATQVYVHRLRRVLGEQRIAVEPSGYSLTTSVDELDSLLFEELVTEARTQRGKGQREKAADLLVEALGLWRGEAFEELAEHPIIFDEARRLDQERLRVLTEQVEIELERGRHNEVIPQLIRLTDQHPYREDLQSNLMLALYRAGRQAEALEAFQQTRKRLDEELGLEPGPALRRLHSLILRSAPDLELEQNHQPAIVPKELPPAVTGFAGRTAQLAMLDRLVPVEGQAISAAVALITGSGGVGKTALALHWAHRMAGNFPDGQLFVDLRGYAAGAQIRPIDALSSFLRCLGMPPQQIPVDTAEAAALYRSRLSGRRVLVILDNARYAEDVRTLLPGAPGCLAVVTSRDRLTGLVARDGATRIPLDVLSPDEAHGLVANLLGPVRAVEPKAIADLATVCAYLPLALRVAIAHMLDRPYGTVEQHIAQLREGSRLELLEVEGDDSAALRSTFALSYGAVSTDAQLLFRRLGLVPCPDFTVEAAAALTDLPHERASKLLERLADAHLVRPLTRGRYAIHDLLREYAQETCQQHDPFAERNAAVNRLYHQYFLQIDTAAELLYPAITPLPSPQVGKARDGFVDTDSALAWLDAEHLNAAAAIRHASSTGSEPMAWLLADRLRGYFDLRRHTALWFTSARAGLAAARAARDERAQAAMFLMLGQAYGVIGKYDTATKKLERAIRLSERSGWSGGLASALGSLGVARGFQGSPDAVGPLLRSLAVLREVGSTSAEVKALNNLANAFRQQGNLKRASDFCHEAVSHQTHRGEPNCVALSSLGSVQHLLGEHHLAFQTFNAALTGLRKVGNKPIEAYTLASASGFFVDAGRIEEAREAATAAISIARAIGHLPALVLGLTVLGRYLHLVGDASGAFEALEEAVEVGTKSKIYFEVTGALLALSRVQLDRRGAAALDSAKRALELSIHGDFRLRQGQAMVALARCHLSNHDSIRALELAGEALEIQRQTGHLLGEADALAVLALADPDPHTSAKYADAARAIYAETRTVPPPIFPIHG